jgi:hypothetical protein
MSIMRECPKCHEVQVVRFTTDGQGHLIEEPLACMHDRTIRPVLPLERCLDCDDDVTGRYKRCGPCRRKKKHKVVSWRDRNPKSHAILAAAQSGRNK